MFNIKVRQCADPLEDCCCRCCCWCWYWCWCCHYFCRVKTTTLAPLHGQTTSHARHQTSIALLGRSVDGHHNWNAARRLYFYCHHRTALGKNALGLDRTHAFKGVKSKQRQDHGLHVLRGQDKVASLENADRGAHTQHTPTQRATPQHAARIRIVRTYTSAHFASVAAKGT